VQFAGVGGGGGRKDARRPDHPRHRDGRASDQHFLEDVMATDSAQAFLACGGMFFLSFFMIWAFWFVERLRGTSAPQLQKAAPLQK
jgi:hypothetical protein